MEAKVRVDKRTKRLLNRIRRGEIAVISHAGLDAVSARALVDAGVSAVLNAQASVSDRYPNRGPSLLLEAGIPVVDELGEEIMTGLTEGEQIRLEGEAVRRDGAVVAQGKLLTPESVDRAVAQAQARAQEELAGFAANTLEYVAEERDLVFQDVDPPGLKTRLKGRHAVVVTRGDGYKDDLVAIRDYLEDIRPVLIGVDGGADALLELGLKPDVIVGDMDSATDAALRSAGELVLHAFPDGRAPGRERLEELGLPYVEVAVAGTSEDVAMLLAHDGGAEIIVAVGTHSGMVDFLDKGRQGMASTFLARLKIGHRLVDARGVSQLYRGGVTMRQMAVLVLAGFITAGTIVSLSPFVKSFIHLVAIQVRVLWRHLLGLFGA
ncbi:MAG: putative cytokinetic ring protein SteA [Armatimonadota bacterium]